MNNTINSTNNDDSNRTYVSTIPTIRRNDVVFNEHTYATKTVVDDNIDANFDDNDGVFSDDSVVYDYVKPSSRTSTPGYTNEVGELLNELSTMSRTGEITKRDVISLLHKIIRPEVERIKARNANQ
jgi:hypothetical protein